MIRSISNMPIFRRLFLAFALAAIIPGIVIIVLGSVYVNLLNTRGNAIQTSNAGLKIAAVALGDLQRMNALLESYHADVYATGEYGIHDPRMNALVQSHYNEILSLEYKFNQLSAEYQRGYELATSSNASDVRAILLQEDPGSQLVDDQKKTLDLVMNQQWPDYERAQDAELLSLKAGQLHSQTHKILLDADAKYKLVVQSWQHVVDLAEKVGNVVANVGPSQTNPVLLQTVIAFVVAIGMVIAIGYIVNLTITRPLRQLATLTRRIGKGDTSARAKLIGRDEIYMVATSMNNMLDNIVRLIQETQAQRDNLQAQVEKLVSEVSGVGEGDLRVQAEVTADALGVLADSFNYMVEELGSLVVRVKLVANEVENTTATVLDRMTQLVESGDIQIQHIAEAAVEVEQMANSSRLVADRSQILYEVAHEARQNAQSGREAVQQAVGGMDRIHENVQTTAGKVQLLGERSREINNIVEVISNIAHQTNRLALDAAIQAAMAGENGKGFGAVAADIRRLAERAKEQASMIARIVRSVRDDIGAVAVSMQDTERETSAGSKLTQEAGNALEAIFTVVERQAREIENINQVAIQQLESSSAVVQIMQGVSDSTQQSSSSTREAAHNVERLARLVEQLRGSVEAFKLRDDHYYITPSDLTMLPSPEAEQDKQMTVSGVFRTVSATAQPSGMWSYNAQPPAAAPVPDPFAFSTMPNQQNGGRSI